MDTNEDNDVTTPHVLEVQGSVIVGEFGLTKKSNVAGNVKLTVDVGASSANICWQFSQDSAELEKSEISILGI